MKFILFNAFVIAALGYMLFERGALDGSRAGEMASKALAAIEDKAKPLLEASEISEPVFPDGAARPERERRDAVATPQSPPVTQGTAAPASSPAEREIAPETAAVSEPAPELDPRVVAEAVAPEVADRRAVVLGSERVPAPEATESKSKISAAERRQRLRAIADEAELLSIELISR